MARSFLYALDLWYALDLRPLERNVVVAGTGFLGEGLGRRDRRRRGSPGAPHELHALSHNLDDGSFAAVLGFPLARLQPALDEDGTALVEIFAAALRLLSPHHDREETGFLPFLAPLRRVVAIDRQPQIGDGSSAGRVTELRGLGQVADQEHLVEARHQVTSSSVGRGSTITRTSYGRSSHSPPRRPKLSA